jgi:hypothetical protein
LIPDFHAVADEDPRQPPGAILTEPRPLSLLNRSLVATTLLAAMIMAAAFWLGAR